MLTVKDVRKVFNKGKPNECVALDNVTVSIEPGKITAFTGPSGSGKTTLLALLGCMARPTAGRIWLNEKEVTVLPERFLTSIRRSMFGFIFQRFNLVEGISVLENVMLPAYPTGEPARRLREKALALLDTFDMSRKAAARVEWLSGGEAQRVAIARALINDPEIVIADEPTAHLDTKLSAEFMQIMKRLNDEGKTVLIASHDPMVFESGLVDRTVSMRDGRVEEPDGHGEAP
jgi:putative ABC transport system ATP-binding protein